MQLCIHSLPSTVGVVDELLANGVHGVLLDIAINDGNGGVSSLREDDGPVLLAVLLRQLSNLLGNLLDVL